MDWIKFYPENHNKRYLDCTIDEYKSQVFRDGEVVEFGSYDNIVVGYDYKGLGVCVGIFEHQVSDGAWIVVQASNSKLIEINIEYRKNGKSLY